MMMMMMNIMMMIMIPERKVLMLMMLKQDVIVGEDSVRCKDDGDDHNDCQDNYFIFTAASPFILL